MSRYGSDYDDTNPGIRRPTHRYEPALFSQGNWEFVLLREDSGRVSGHKAMLNGRFIAMVIPRGNDLMVLMADPEGSVKDTQSVIEAFMQYRSSMGRRER